MDGTNRWSPERIAEAAAALEGQAPEVVLQWAYQQFTQDEIMLACSFGAEDVALVDMISRVRRGARAFYLDTDVLFPETYDLIDRVTAKYDVQVERISPLITLEEQMELHGDALWEREPDSCCAIRKVEPLGRALFGLSAWITGIRREQSPTRAGAKPVEWDTKFGLVKINPLVAWTEKQLWQYITEHHVPYNPLHDQGYPSIGCLHCTRPVRPGEDPRSGRWSGHAKTECGLHQ